MTATNVWIQKQNILLSGDLKKSIRPKRRYFHFDDRINKVTEAIAKRVLTTDEVLRHSFYPFIQYQKIIRRRKKGEVFTGYTQKKRPISYAAHLDTLIFSWYSQQLETLYEETIKSQGIDTSVLAYRPKNGSNVDHACRAFRAIQNMTEANVVCIDIEGFFDHLSHKLLKEQWLELLKTRDLTLTQLPSHHYKVFKAITRFSFVDAEQVYSSLELDPKNPRPKHKARLCSSQEFRMKIADKGLIRRNNAGFGIPQGSSISATLANLYMIRFDLEVQRQVENWGGQYFRYSDDILIIVPRNIDKSDVENFVQKEIASVELTINHDKTELFNFRLERGILTSANAKTGRKKNLNYLGVSYDGGRVFLKHASLAQHQKKAVAAVRSALSYSIKKGKPVPRRKIYERYTKMGRQNFHSYVKRGLITLKKEGFDANYLRRQTSDFFVQKLLKRLREPVLKRIIERKKRRAKRKAMKRRQVSV